jgi:hypothetical protein
MQQPGIQATENLTLMSFLGAQEQNLLVSLDKFRAEVDAFKHVEGLYHAASDAASLPDEHLVKMQLFLFTQYQLYSSFSCMLRGHLAESFTAVRIAVEATLQAYRIMEGSGNSEDFIRGEETYKYTVNHVRQARKKDTSRFPLADKLISMHEACSQYAVHADIHAFVHRAEIIETEDQKQFRLQYFQLTPEHEFAGFILSVLRTFAQILSTFSDFLKEVGLVDDGWMKEVEFCSGQVEKMGEQRHKLADKAKEQQ